MSYQGCWDQSLSPIYTLLDISDRFLYVHTRKIWGCIYLTSNVVLDHLSKQIIVLLFKTVAKFYSSPVLRHICFQRKLSRCSPLLFDRSETVIGTFYSCWLCLIHRDNCCPPTAGCISSIENTDFPALFKPM